MGLKILCTFQDSDRLLPENGTRSIHQLDDVLQHDRLILFQIGLHYQVWAYPMGKMEDMSSTASLGGGGEFLQDALGKAEADRINDIYQKVTKSRMRQVIKFRPELSTSIGNDEN